MGSHVWGPGDVSGRGRLSWGCWNLSCLWLISLILTWSCSSCGVSTRISLIWMSKQRCTSGGDVSVAVTARRDTLGWAELR